MTFDLIIRLSIMNFKISYVIPLLILLAISLTSYGQSTRKNGVLVLYRDNRTDKYGYKDLKGHIVIPSAKYSYCFTDTFRTYAIVSYSHEGFVGINRKEKILYGVFPIDNGPDYTSEGLFRIVVKNKIGYADSLTGKIVIKPQFKCAWPFEKGKAQVSRDCETKKLDEEHKTWLNTSWYYINKTGKKVDPPMVR